MATPILSGPQFPHLHNEMGGEQRRDYANCLGDSTGGWGWVASLQNTEFCSQLPTLDPSLTIHHLPPKEISMELYLT